MKLYWPESKEKCDTVGYNHAVGLLRKAIGKYISDDPKECSFRVYCNLPWHHDPAWLKKEGLPILAYTMYEASRVPSGWINFLNRHVAVVLVPSEWCRKAFVDSGCTRPVLVVSLGVDPEECPDLQKWEGDDTDPYVFLWQGVAYDPNGRKGVESAVQTFRELKSEGLLKDEDELVLKFRPYEGREFVMDDVRSPMGIRYIQTDMPRHKLHDLYREADCCVNPTHGEGFGLIPLEQMAMGKPVIVTGYSLPYTAKSVCLTVEYDLKRSPIVWNHKHIIASLNGLSLNTGGLPREYLWMPKQIQRRATRNHLRITEKGMAPYRMGIAERLLNHNINAVRGLQSILRLYRKQRKPICLYQENPGMDAHVRLRDLKAKMMWCYRNREAARDMGFLAREYVLRHWTIDRIREEFENITLQKELEQWSR